MTTANCFLSDMSVGPFLLQCQKEIWRGSFRSQLLYPLIASETQCFLYACSLAFREVISQSHGFRRVAPENLCVTTEQRLQVSYGCILLFLCHCWSRRSRAGHCP